MRALDIKLFRDLWGMKGQAFAIAMVIAGGTATYILASSTLDSLTTTQATLYREDLFADVFSSLKRAPESVRSRIAEITGVQSVETRIAVPATIDLPSYDQPVSALVLSLPDNGPAVLNRLRLRSGRMPEDGREREAVISDGFALAHKLRPGAALTATIYGRRQTLHITGIVASTEFIYQLQPGSIIPDFKGYAILWMNEDPVETAYNMTGAFNQVAVRLDRGAVEKDVILRMDEILQPYGGLGAYGRPDQVSHKYLSEEFKQLTTMATIFPAIFLSVGAFLLNVVCSRLMATQRGQIAILKAFGYTTPAIAVHFLKLTLIIVVIGNLIGIAAGAWMGRGMSNMYMEFYRFPKLEYVLRGHVVVVSVVINAIAASIGTVYAVIRAASESPAQAMQPQAPGNFRMTILERLGAARHLSQPTRMILRNLERRPLKALLSIIGVALSGAILVMGGFWGDAVDYMLTFQFKQAQRDDLMVVFNDAVSPRALGSLTGIPGVTYAEPFRSVAVRLRVGHKTYRTSIQGLEDGGQLRRLLNTSGDVVSLPEHGLLLTDYLARILHVRPGDMVQVEVMEGRRGVYPVPLAAVASEYIGVSAYMRRDALNRLLREGGSMSGAYLAADMTEDQRIFARLKEMPMVAATTSRRRLLESFYETMARQMLTFAFFNTILAATIAVGVIYNTARIAFSERSRELASLRVLGYTRGEISYILLGELAVIVFLAIPLGCWLGWQLCKLAAGTPNDLFRIPMVIEPGTYAFSALMVLGAATLSGLMVRRKLDHLDLVEVLKTRE
ncbi:MAG TPA: ABC transporter permease [Bryobacteraceae bacterium]|nr:ABC transporter permease [Bryobacteraceae bacterium]